MKATERLYLTTDRARVVREGDAAAAFLWKTPGKDISAADARRYGLDELEEVEEPTSDEPDSEEEPEEKAVEGPPENKAVSSAPGTRTRGRRSRSR